MASGAGEQSPVLLKSKNILYETGQGSIIEKPAIETAKETGIQN